MGDQHVGLRASTPVQQLLARYEPTRVTTWPHR
jgi:hypothetical protein